MAPKDACRELRHPGGAIPEIAARQDDGGRKTTAPLKGRPTAAAISSILDERVVRIAKQPALARLGRGDHRMTRRVRVLGGMTVGRVVAAPCPAALLAGTQVNPGAAHLDAVLAFLSFGQPGLGDGLDMGTARCW